MISFQLQLAHRDQVPRPTLQPLLLPTMEVFLSYHPDYIPAQPHKLSDVHDVDRLSHNLIDS